VVGRAGLGAAIAAAVILMTSLGITDPHESDPDAAARDADYAAGKQAMERKDWQGAVGRFEFAARRNPDSADLHNYLGYSYRNLRAMGLAFKPCWYRLRSSGGGSSP
jgi:Flp pilus assembly protein TadD